MFQSMQAFAMVWKAPIVLLLALLGLFLLRPPQLSTLSAQTPTTPPTGAPVVLELFTSEGCSSCPPADALLKKLEDVGRVGDTDIIAIEEHVDYWNHLGWTDPFSSHDWTERQQRYAEVFRRDGAYTPQLVVNGSEELVGSDGGRLRSALANAAAAPKLDLRISAVNLTPKSAELSIDLGNAQKQARSSELWVAVTERELSSNVLRGENEGRSLAHAAVLRSLTRIHIAKDSPAATAKVSLPPTWKRQNLRFVVFLQDPKTLHILGAAVVSSPG